MRESLYEQLKKKELSFINELVKITNLIDASYVNTPFYFEAAFKKSCFVCFLKILIWQCISFLKMTMSMTLMAIT